jgi:steroid delta-isomerase-like uncharacterized protein
VSHPDSTAVIERYAEEVFNGGNLAAIDDYIDPGYIRHDPGLPFVVQGPEGVRQMVTAFRTAFPDIHFDCQAIIADGDHVAAHWLASGTHQGDLMGLPPTGKSVTVSAIEIYRLAGGKIAEQWVVVDNTSMLRQLGAEA